MKFTDYKDYEQHIVLCDDVPEIENYYIKLPTPPKLETFKNYGKEPLKQFYHTDRIPDKLLKLNKLDRDEAFAIAMKDKECMDFIAMVWDKRINGEWVFINGMPLYIPPVYYFYLNFYHLDTGLPKFRKSDLDYYYWWEFAVVQDPMVFGGQSLGRRRLGKSYRACAILLEYCTSHSAAFCGLQSKNEKDAETLFARAVVNPFRKLPFFFKPYYDRAGKLKNDIQFTTYGENPDELNSWIDFRSSVATAYDSQKLHRWFLDEGGKMVPPTNPVDIYDKTRECLVEDEKIIGKAIADTTLEEAARGGMEKYKEIWVDSSRNPNDKKMNELGQTTSGLVQFFVPSHKCYIFDRFGFPIVEAPSGYQLEDRKRQCTDEQIEMGLHKMGALELLESGTKDIKDQKKRQDRIRKYPRTVTEAFRNSGNSCHFNLGIINDRLDYYTFDKEREKVRGNFEWKDGQEDTEVIWRPTPNGRWLMAYVLDQEQSNRKGENGGKRIPLNFDKFVIGCDPFKYNVTTSNKPSHGAGYQWMYFDQSIDGQKDEIDWLTDDFVGEYLYRPATTDLFAEDMLMWAIYSSCKVNPEMNADIISKHFVRRGYEKYLHYGKKLVKKDGVVQIKENINSGATTLGGAMKDSLFASVDWYIETHGNRCKFPNFLTDCREVGYDNISPFDSFVAGAYTLMPVRELKTRTKKEPVSFRSFMQMRKY
jgi:hypothetical protein